LATGVPRSVPIAWTGVTVVCDEITHTDASARAAAVGERAPLVWDNYPVNDAVMADRMFLGPLRGRDPGLAEVCSGYVANPMVQPHASKLPLASIAAFLEGDDPEAMWIREADGLGVRALAEACDGGEPRRLVDALTRSDRKARDTALVDVERWLDSLDRCSPSEPLAAEVAPWSAQANREAKRWRASLRLLRAIDRADPEAIFGEVFGLIYTWPRVRSSDVSVFGPRLGFRPVLGQWPDGSWRYDASSLDENDNATDALVRFALDEAARWAPT
jgi:hyaluronoglucosaminidase